MSSSLLLIGVTGSLGRLLVHELERRGVPHRALVRSPDRENDLGARPLVELVPGDLREPASIDAALEGIDRVFLLSPPDRDQIRLQGNVIEAAERTGRPLHVVQVSALGAVPEDAPLQLARWHAVTEAQLRSVELPFTILRPQFLMQNFLRVASSIQTENMLCGSFDEARLPLVDGRDVAAVAATVLTTDGHHGCTYTLTGPQALSYTEVAATFSAVLGRPIRYVDMPSETYHEYLVGGGLAHWMADDLAQLARSFRRGRPWPVTGDVLQVAGQPARTLATFIRDHAGHFQPAGPAPLVSRRILLCATTFWPEEAVDPGGGGPGRARSG
jgi:uncharacterized protein YbjT (DUF2867 family)